ncbi:hypothetical protein ACKI14_50215, partial [Streptomyces turgidiscabies]|uniref:hypothetical protein n=1 Tax=Streptomyces turgidiscabies TaxID=85558 RepID=UPI0038F6BED8
ALSTSAEAVLLSGADTVVTTPGGEGQTLALLQRLGIRIVSVAAAENFSEVLSSLRRTAAQLDNAQPDAPLSDAAQPDTAP